jgi:hypothetical protein
MDIRAVVIEEFTIALENRLFFDHSPFFNTNSNTNKIYIFIDSISKKI